MLQTFLTTHQKDILENFFKNGMISGTCPEVSSAAEQCALTREQVQVSCAHRPITFQDGSPQNV